MSRSSQRKSPRHTLRFRVRSRDLPGFRALTCDLSQTGAQLETQAKLTPGEQLYLEFEFDRPDLADLECLARVVWSTEVEGDRDFRAGVHFLPEDEGKRRDLARMATVLQARSEADLEELLVQAKRLDPERAQTFARVRSQSDPKRQGSRVHPALGVLIPLRIEIVGYEWDRARQSVMVRFTDKSGEHRLHFPQCRLLTDHGCSLASPVGALYSTPFSETLKRLPGAVPSGGWKHYRFLTDGREPVLDLISGPCQVGFQGSAG